jgi:hypothetical protein
MDDKPENDFDKQSMLEELARAKVVSTDDDLLFHGVDTAAENERLLALMDRIASAPPVSDKAPGVMVPLSAEIQFHFPAGDASRGQFTEPKLRMKSGLQTGMVPKPEMSLSSGTVDEAVVSYEDSELDQASLLAPTTEPRSIPRRRRSDPLGKEAIAGLELGSNQISAVCLQWRNNRIEVQAAGKIQLDQADDPSAAVPSLKKLWKNSRLPTRSVWAHMHSRLMIQKFFALKLSEEQLRQALRLEAEELLQIDQNDIVMDYHLNDERGPHGELCGMMYALPRWELLEYLNALKNAHLLVCGISVGPCDLTNLYQELNSASDESFATGLINLSENSADIVLLYGKNSLYSRTVFSRAGIWDANMGYLVECLNDAVLYFGQWISLKPVDKVLLCGRIPKTDDPCGFLLQETGLPVYVYDPLDEDSHLCWPNVRLSEEIEPIELIGAIAVALRRE